MAEVKLTRGLVAIVDDGDLDLVNQYRWHALPTTGGRFYAQAHHRLPNGKRTSLLMHRLLLQCRGEVDHANNDGLDNRRRNLRESTHSQNQANTPKRRGTSRFKGVSWHKHEARWRASITSAGKSRSLGYFDDEELAARAYDRAAAEAFGVYARLNFNGATP